MRNLKMIKRHFNAFFIRKKLLSKKMKNKKELSKMKKKNMDCDKIIKCER